jgi:hypothetical protein
MYLEGYITKLDALTHNLPCLSLPVCNSTSAAQSSKQNSMFFLYYSTRSWDQKVSTLQHRQTALPRRCCKNWKLKEASRLNTEQQHGAGCVTAPSDFTSDDTGEQPALFVKEQHGKQNMWPQAASNTQFVRSAYAHRNWGCSVLQLVAMCLAPFSSTLPMTMRSSSTTFNNLCNRFVARRRLLMNKLGQCVIHLTGP